MSIVISFNFSYFFLLFYFTQYWNSTTPSLSLNYLYFLSLFVFSSLLVYSILKFNHILLIIKLFIFSLSFCLKKNVTFYLNQIKENCARQIILIFFLHLHFLQPFSFSLPFHLPKHSTLTSLFLFPFIFLYFISFYYHPLSINLSFTLPLFT